MNSYYPSLDIAQEIKKMCWTPVFVTNGDVIRKNCNLFLSAFEEVKTKVFYALKANFNPFIVRIIKENWIEWIDAVSINEVKYALKLWYSPSNIIFTWINVSEEDMVFIWSNWVLFNIWSVSELKKYSKLFPNWKISLRLNPNIWAWRNELVTTWWKNTKFWIDINSLQEAYNIILKSNLQLIWLHCHIWSWFFDIDKFLSAVDFLIMEAEKNEQINFINFWWWFWVQHSEDDPIFDMSLLWKILKQKLQNFNNKTWRDIEMRFEPWSFLVEESTCLLSTITNIKESNSKKFLWLDSWLNLAPDPALYKMYHEILNLSNINWDREIVNIVWNICENWDIFAENRLFPKSKEWDIVALLTVWWYSASASSNYNMRSKAPEVLIDNNKILLTKKRENLDDIIAWYNNFNFSD